MMSIMSRYVAEEFTRFFSLPFTASNITSDDLSRQQRHLLYTYSDQPPVRASWAGGEGYACITSRGILGSCQSFRNCYPFFKHPPPVVRFPVLNAWDTWVLGNYDTCSYYTDDGREAHGACCTNPITPTAPTLSDGTEHNKIDLPIQNTNIIQSISQWPPPIPTHPPDHTAATHSPAIFDSYITTKKPFVTSKPFATSTTSRPTIATTWATRPPAFGAPFQTTTKRPTFVVTTEAPIINDVSISSGSCGAKNGLLVC